MKVDGGFHSVEMTDDMFGAGLPTPSKRSTEGLLLQVAARYGRPKIFISRFNNHVTDRF